MMDLEKIQEAIQINENQKERVKQYIRDLQIYKKPVQFFLHELTEPSSQKAVAKINDAVQSASIVSEKLEKVHEKLNRDIPGEIANTRSRIEQSNTQIDRLRTNIPGGSTTRTLWLVAALVLIALIIFNIVLMKEFYSEIDCSSCVSFTSGNSGVGCCAFIGCGGLSILELSALIRAFSKISEIDKLQAPVLKSIQTETKNVENLKKELMEEIEELNQLNAEFLNAEAIYKDFIEG